MRMIKLGRKGQVSIPKQVLQQLGIAEDSPLLVEVTDDGAILLRPAVVYPLETYGERRLKEFAAADRMTPGANARLKNVLKGG